MRWTIALTVMAVLVVLGVAAGTRADDEKPAGEKRLTKEAPGKQPVDADHIRKLVQDLGAEAFDRRDAAYRELARIGAPAIPELEKALKSDDVQIRVSAERLLRRLRAASTAEKRPAPAPDRPRERHLDEFLRELEERGLPGLGEDWEEWHRQMDRRFQEMRKQLRALEEDLDRDVREGIRRAPSGGTSERHVRVQSDDEAIDCRVDAEGKVTVGITTKKDGREETATYEAPGAEEFRKRHPEIWERVKGFLGDGNRLRVEIGPSIRLWRFGTDPRRAPTPLPVPAPAEGPRLGIYTAEITPALRSHLALGPDEGLLVDAVQPGSLAARLGLERYDVVLRIGGESVGSPGEVRTVLAKLPADAPVKVTVARRGKRLELVEPK